MKIKQRSAWGEKNARAVLKEEQVRRIRRELSEHKTVRSIAKKYKVSDYCIYSIKKGKSWRNLI